MAKLAYAFVPGAVFVALLGFPAEAGHTFSAQGWAQVGAELYRASVGGQLQRFEEPGTVGMGIILFRNAPTPTNLFELEIVDEAYFLGTTNFIDGEEFEGSVPLQQNFFVESTTPGVTFRLSGIRAAQSFAADGQFQQYSLVLGPVEL